MFKVKIKRGRALCRRFQSARAWPKVGTSSVAVLASPSTAAARSTPAVSTHWLESLGVFAAAYGTFLLTGDDEEFAKLGRPLPVDEVPLLVATLRDALWHILWWGAVPS